MVETSGFSLSLLSSFMVLGEPPYTVPSPGPSARRTILHGTSQLLPKGWFSFIRTLESTYPYLSGSTYPESLAQEKAWVSLLLLILLSRPAPPTLYFTSSRQFVRGQPMGRKPGKNFWTFAHQFIWFWITYWKLKLAPVAPCLQGGPVGQNVPPSKYRGAEWNVGKVHVTG